MISFRMDWLDLLEVQGTLKSLLQHHSSKASILRHSAFFTVQLSHPYMTTGKTIALTKRTFVGKVMSLLLNMLSRLVMYGHESWTVKKAERRRIDAFELWCWSPLDCKEIQPVHSEGDQPWDFFGRDDAKAETSTLTTSCEELTHWKRL